jgi:aryl-alcohol dehydrogenase-like predicted oxidoreductase
MTIRLRRDIMKPDSSRRKFLAAGLRLPVAGLAASRLAGASALPLVEPAAATPHYRVLGKTGLKVTPVGFGCLVTSDSSVIAQALDMGINFFDTARNYQGGNNERMVGAALKGVRDKAVLCTKSTARTGAEALADLDTSLQTLGTDHVDIWYMHSKDSPASITDDVLAAFESAKKQGKTRFIGVSTHDLNDVADRIVQTGRVDVVLFTYNFTMGKTKDAALEKLRDAGIGAVAMKVMAPAVPGRPSNRPQMKNPAGPLAALKWALRNPAIASAIPSMADTDQLEMNFRAMSERFDASDERVLARLNEEIRPLYCRMCSTCSGKCPKGLPVANTLRFLAYADFYGQFALGREHFLELPKAVRSVRCSDCSSCPIQCPNGVRVTERLIRAQELFA